MEFLKKQKNPPKGWDQLWKLNDGITLASEYEEFIKAPLPGSRKTILDILIAEQNGLCFYCQNDNINSFTIEHLIPQSDNPDLSLNYHNLTAVCTTCNGNRGNLLIPFLCLFKGSSILNFRNGFFNAYADGQVMPNPKLRKKHYNYSDLISEYQMIEAYISAIGLNREELINARKLCYSKQFSQGDLVSGDRRVIRRYLENKFNSLLIGPPIRFRLFLLLVLASKIQKF